MRQGALSVELHPKLPAGYCEKAAVPIKEDGIVPGLRIPKKVVYFPSCVTRMMGPSRSDPEQARPTPSPFSFPLSPRQALPAARSPLQCLPQWLCLGWTGLQEPPGGPACQLMAGSPHLHRPSQQPGVFPWSQGLRM